MKIKKFILDEAGLNHFFGPLEARIMDIFWFAEGLTIKDVQMRLDQDGLISFNTVMTVMNRLSVKGHLLKTQTFLGKSRVTIYKTVQSKKQFLTEQSKAVAQELINEFGGILVNHVIDSLDNTDPELIAKLDAKLSDLKRRIPSECCK